MISNNDYSTDGQSLHHNRGSKGSMNTVRVGSRRLPLYLLVFVCLGLLNAILLLTALVIGIYCSKANEDFAPHQITVQSLIAEVNQLQIMHSEATNAQKEAKQAFQKEIRNHQQLKLQLEQNRSVSDSLQRQLETLHQERATLLNNTSDIRDNCGRCLPGWLLLNTSCYFHAKSAFNALRSWSDSRADCVSRGSDLAVVDNWDEQLNLFDFLPKVDLSVRPWWSRPGSIWIGLTDLQTEGTWVWVNNTTLTDGGYWIIGEPNNHKEEDCAAFLKTDNPRRTWFDSNCQENKEWLCEMKPN